MIHYELRTSSRLAFCLALFAFAITALHVRADIYQWEYVDPTDPSQGKRQSTTLAPGGAGVNAVSGANLSSRDLTMAYLIGKNLSSAKLMSANLTNADLTNAGLRFATLTGANFSGAEIRGVNFGYSSGFTAAQLQSTASYQNGNLTGVVADNFDFAGLDLSGRDLTNARFDEAELAGVNLTGSIIRGTSFNYSKGLTTTQLASTASYQARNLAGVGLRYLDLTGISFAEQDLTNAWFESAILTNVDFSNADLTNAELDIADLNGAEFTSAEIRGARFGVHPSFGGTGLTLSQLYSTASYEHRDLSGIGLENNNLTGANLAGVILSKSRLDGADLSGADLNGADLTDASLPFVDLTNGNLSQANLAHVAGYGAKLTGANLNEAKLANAALNAANLTDSNLSGADLSKANFDSTNSPPFSADLTNASLADANLSMTNLRGAILTDADFTNAEVRGASFARRRIVGYEGTGITAAQLQSTASYQIRDLSGVDLSGGLLAGIDFTGQILTGVVLEYADLRNTDFRQQNLAGITLFGATVTDANFSGAQIKGGLLSATNLSAAQLYSTASYQEKDLTGLRLSGMNLSGWNFAGINLSLTTLNESILTDADFSGALLRDASLTTGGTGLSATQLYSTASYQLRDLRGLRATTSDLSSWNLSHQNLAGAKFENATMIGTNLQQANLNNAYLRNTNLTNADLRYADIDHAHLVGVNLAGANLSGLDFRLLDEARIMSMEAAILSNTILRSNFSSDQDGDIKDLDLTAGKLLVVRNFPGSLIVVTDETAKIGEGGALRLLLDDYSYFNPIWGAAEVSGLATLQLAFAEGINVANQLGRTYYISIDFIDAFMVESPYVWDLTNLYTTGEITLLAVPEPIALSLIGIGGAAGTLMVSRRRRPLHRRRLRFESLEDRRLLATFTVTNLNDGPVTAAGQLPGSLRQAIFDANALAGADTINFSGVGGTLTMTAGQFVLTGAVTIDGPGATNLTIDAQQQSRIFNITVTPASYTIRGLKLTGGKTTGDNLLNGVDSTFSGGAIRAIWQQVSKGSFILDQCTLTGNSTSGQGADGGAVFANGVGFTISNSIISGNSTSGLESFGGAIAANQELTILDSTIHGNSTSGYGALGGGIYALGATVIRSTISGNSTLGEYAEGGGIFASGMSMTDSTVNGNSTAGSYSSGGGLAAYKATITNSWVNGNSTAGYASSGGGIGANFPQSFEIVNSTVSGNHTSAQYGYGGGVFAIYLTLTNSTISGNSTIGGQAGGGGIAALAATIAHSTISGNSVAGSGSTGGGIHLFNQYGDEIESTIKNSIIAGNTASDEGPDLRLSAMNLIPTICYSLIGNNADTELVAAPLGMPDANGNLIGTPAAPIDSLLGALAYNGGPTFLDGTKMLTHALLVNSPAIDAGDPMTSAAILFDQRGTPFVRVFDGDGVDGARLDMGAFELDIVVVPPALPGDYNNDNAVDAADYVVWRKALGASNIPAYSGADGNGDTTVDESDYEVWRNHFGQVLEMESGMSSESEAIVRAAAKVSAALYEQDETVSELDLAAYHASDVAIEQDFTPEDKREQTSVYGFVSTTLPKRRATYPVFTHTALRETEAGKLRQLILAGNSSYLREQLDWPEVQSEATAPNKFDDALDLTAPDFNGVCLDMVDVDVIWSDISFLPHLL